MSYLSERRTRRRRVGGEGVVGSSAGAVAGVGRSGLRSLGFPKAPRRLPCPLRFQRPPVEPCMRCSGTRLTDVFHRRCSAMSARQARLGLGATTVPSSVIRPSRFGDSRRMAQP